MTKSGTSKGMRAPKLVSQKGQEDQKRPQAVSQKGREDPKKCRPTLGSPRDSFGAIQMGDTQNHPSLCVLPSCHREPCGCLPPPWPCVLPYSLPAGRAGGSPKAPSRAPWLEARRLEPCRLPQRPHAPSRVPVGFSRTSHPAQSGAGRHSPSLSSLPPPAPCPAIVSQCF